MNEQKPSIDLNLFKGNSPFLGQSLLRDVLIPNLLGNETNEILYWAGKEIARQYPLSSDEDTILFFERVGFGDLTLKVRNQHSIVFQLAGTCVESRIKAVNNLSFNLESGFLAEQIQQQESNYTEAFYQIDQKNLTVAITLKQDAKDLEPIASINHFFTLDELSEEKDIPNLFGNEIDQASTKLVIDNDKIQDNKINDKKSIFEKLPSRSSRHTKKK
ncbi:MAG: YslB family protein [Carnobacterium sp.]|uniref:YslB family protein n=1 Tax=Carnobacterium sp. TaxID=48221 RepID=UPI003C756D31